jgi:hypothetical protein
MIDDFLDGIALIVAIALLALAARHVVLLHV